MSRIEPLWLAELDGHLESVHPLPDLLDVRERTRRRQKPRRELEEDGGELARGAKRLERGAEAVPRLVDELVRQVLEVEVLLLQEIRRNVRPDVRRHRKRFRGVVREQRERLDVEDKAGRCLRGPGLDRLGLWDAVVSRIDLDQRELGGVETQPVD